MCGILGMGFQSKNWGKYKDLNSVSAQLILKRMLDRSTRRGRDATGMALITTTKATVLKHHIPGRAFVETEAFENATDGFLDMSKAEEDGSRPLIVLGHNRAKTQGTYLNKHNNHPIITNQVIGVHNGVIGNDSILFNSYSQRIKRKAEVDSEIIFRLIDYYANKLKRHTSEAIKRTAFKLNGSYACATVNMQTPWMLWLFRGNAPIDILYYPEAGLILFASERVFITQAVGNMNLGPVVELPMAPHTAMGINLKQNQRTRFNLPGIKHKSWVAT
jgi:glucosamine--fructose-6-phosphate aminotransferase (isomerizing)